VIVLNATRYVVVLLPVLRVSQEIAVIRGALDLTSKTAFKSMTPLDKVSPDQGDEAVRQAVP
jgi:hypothetical protein